VHRCYIKLCSCNWMRTSYITLTLARSAASACTQDGTFHLFCECTHPAVQAEREALLSTLPMLLGRPTALICNALRAQFAPVETRQRVSDLSDRLLTLAATANWHSRDGKAVTFRLVTVVPFPAKIATALPDQLPQLQLVQAQIFDSTVVQDRWLRPLPTTGSSGPCARSDALQTCGRTPLGPRTLPAQKMLPTAMLPTCQTLANPTLAAMTARATTTLRDRSLTRTLTRTRRASIDAHDWPRDARAPLSVNRCCVLAQPALPYRAHGSSPVCRCGGAGTDASQLPSSRWHVCESRPSLGAA